jgi:predicted metal-dependent enzyme (double-stranded beta helix superfamily)
MAQEGGRYFIRDVSRELISVIEQHETDHDSNALRDGLLRATKSLRARPDLYTLGVKREGNHITNTKYLYYDGQLQITLDELPNGKKIPAHNHGIWEALILCSGRLAHTVYERADDGKVEGYADLRVVEDRVFGPQEIAMVVPPADIHGFTALEDKTFVLTIVGGEYSPTRHYYQVEKKTYAVRTPKALRESGALEAVQGGGKS